MLRFVILLGWLLVFPFALILSAHVNPMPTTTNFADLLTPGRHIVSVPVDSFERKFIFVTPAGFKPGQPLPLVFFFHGAGGSAWQASRTYGWMEKADKENIFVAFPDGMPVRPENESSFLLNPNIWRDGRAGMPTHNVNDIHFFEVLLAKLEAALPVDTNRIYITGFSNGAAMTFTLGRHFSDRIASIAPVSSQSFTRIDKLARPLPVYYLTGTADPLIPFHGGPVTLPWGKTRDMPPVQDSVDEWVRLNGCPLQPQVISDNDGVRVLRYAPGSDDSEILFTVVEGNGHHWPDTQEPLPRAICGPTLDPFNATDRIWDFFQHHPLR